MKDPLVLLQEIEEIEKLEGEGASEPMPNEKGLLEKKRKLHGNLDRIVKYWVSPHAPLPPPPPPPIHT